YDAKDGRRDARLQPRIGPGAADGAGDTGAEFEVARLPLDRRVEAEHVEHARAQRAGDPSDGANRLVDGVRHGAGAPGELRIGVSEVGFEPLRIHLQAGEFLTQLIVDFTGDVSAFLLPGGLGPAGEGAKLLARGDQLLFDFLLAGDVGAGTHEPPATGADPL